MRLTLAATVLLAATLGLPHPAASQGSQRSVPVSEELLSAMAFRTLGPGLVSGRIQDIVMDPNDTNVWYVASVAWKKGDELMEVGPKQSFLVVRLQQ